MTWDNLSTAIAICASYWEGVSPWLVGAEIVRALAAAGMLALGVSFLAQALANIWGGK